MWYLLAIIMVACALAGGASWLLRAVRKLSHKHRELEFADKQLAACNILCARAPDGPKLQQILEQAQLSREIYQSVAQEYNLCLAKPKNRLIALCLGYRPAPEVKTE